MLNLKRTLRFRHTSLVNEKVQCVRHDDLMTPAIQYVLSISDCRSNIESYKTHLKKRKNVPNQAQPNHYEPHQTAPDSPCTLPTLTSSVASVSAPAFNSAPTTASWPNLAAKCSGVTPSCGTRLPVSQDLPRGWHPAGIPIARPSPTTPYPLQPPTPPSNPSP